MNARNILAGLAIGATAMFGVTACGPDEDTDTDIETSEAGTFFEALNGVDASYGGDEEKAIAVAESVCIMLEDGASFFPVASKAMSSLRISPEDSGAVVGAAVFAYCPEEYPRLERELEDYDSKSY